MKKIILAIAILLIITGCTKNNKSSDEEIYTKIVVANNNYISILYPITNISKLDNAIKNFVETEEEAFLKEYSTELNLKSNEFNVDYEYYTVNDRYVNVLLKTLMNNKDLAHPISNVKTFVYDKETNRFLDLSEVITKQSLKNAIPLFKKELITKYKDCLFLDQMNNKINHEFKNYPLFNLTDENLILYFPPYELTAGYCGIIKIEVPLSKLELKIPVFKNEPNVMEPVFIENNRQIDPSKPVIALTFDDGPSKYTSEIVNLLKEYQGNATFFVVGNKVENYKETLRSLIKEGNEIGNHSYNHQWMSRMSSKELENQIKKTQDLVYNTTGYTPTLIRPTYGSLRSNIEGITHLKIALWDIDPKDWKYKSSSKIAQRVLDKAEDGKVILLHDIFERTVESLKIILPELKKNGYQLVTLNELEEIKRIRNLQ